MSKTMILKPRVSEKAYAQSQDGGRVYVFMVPGDSSKQSVAAAVKDQFKVSVENVNMTNIKGKAKRTIRRGGRPVYGRTSDFKKAYVTVKEGDSIPIFKAVEDEKKPTGKKEKK